MIKLYKTDFSKLFTNYKVSVHESLILLSNILGVSYSELFFSDIFEMSELELDLFKANLQRRAQGEPISKIIEKKEFYGINYKTNKYTLDPRPETELIVDLFKEYFPNIEERLNILDLGCGTGCIGLTILKLYKNLTCEFVDISEPALDIARYNAQNLSLSNRARFQLSDWFDNLFDHYDAIVTNPPYISEDFVVDSAVRYDPEIALFAKEKGMQAIIFILSHASSFLKPNGLLFMEIGFDQSHKIRRLKKNLRLIKVAKDLGGIERVVVLKNIISISAQKQ